MRIAEMQRRIVTDPEYAATLADKVLKLHADGVIRGEHKADAWRDVLGELAESPEELSRLMAVNEPIEGQTWTTVSITSTITTTTTMPCLTTTTTSVTTTIFAQ
jgi:hypothetical protein